MLLANQNKLKEDSKASNQWRNCGRQGLQLKPINIQRSIELKYEEPKQIYSYLKTGINNLILSSLLLSLQFLKIVFYSFPFSVPLPI